jgi:hypothetical protein
MTGKAEIRSAKSITIYCVPVNRFATFNGQCSKQCLIVVNCKNTCLCCIIVVKFYVLVSDLKLYVPYHFKTKCFL